MKRTDFMGLCILGILLNVVIAGAATRVVVCEEAYKSR